MSERLKRCLKAVAQLTPQEKLTLRDYLVKITAVQAAPEEDPEADFRDKRRSPRFRVELAGNGVLLRETATLKDNKRFQIKILDISKEGVRFRARKKIHTHDVCLLNFRMKNSGLKKIHIEVVWSREIGGQAAADPLGFEFEYGGCVVTESKVQHLMVNLERQLKVNEILARRGFKVLCGFPPLVGQGILAGLTRDGYQVDEVGAFKELLSRLLGAAFTLMIIDESLIRGGLADFITQVRKYRQELLILLLQRETGRPIYDPALRGIQVAVRWDTPVGDILKLVERLLRQSLCHNWQLVTRTKLKLVCYSEDPELGSRLEECFKKIKYYFFLEMIVGRYPGPEEVDHINSFDFLFLDVRRLDFDHLDVLQEVLPRLTLPALALEDDTLGNEHLQLERFDAVLSLPLQVEKLEQTLMETFKNYYEQQKLDLETAPEYV